MAKILVADDNSNIQKMVGLALKDQGIDVVAVGNGEAAVRKISDIRPDLVLADVFMPVRNGYEVCQYVKMDASLAHIPVILLVGAFDPLDEQEAQRVGADGVLKKPFVPPDPLISMVKSALLRAGVASGNAGAAKTPEPEVLKASDLLTPSAAAMSSLGNIPVRATTHEPVIAALEQESFVDEVPARPEPVRIDSTSQPVAFGSLLETPAEQKEDEIDFLPPVNSELATERDWRGGDVEETDDEEAEDEKPAAPWRPEAAESYPDAGVAGGAKDWRSGSFEQILARKAHGDSWEPAEEKPEVVEKAPAASTFVKEAPPVPASIPAPTAHPETISATPFAVDAWAAVTSSASQEKTSAKTSAAVEEVTQAKEQEQSSAGAVGSAPEASQAAPQTKTSQESWFSVPSNPWNAELEKANRLASTWDSGTPVAAPPVSSNGAEKASETVNETTQGVIEEMALPEATVEAIREEAAQVAEDATQFAEQHPSDGAGFYATEEVEEASAPEPVESTAPSMDDLVAKVLAKLNPEMLQAVTREILKPVVEAMVKEEMKSKKS